jgi:16S rRNA (cytosine967-C5)-methyltransferase
MPHPHADGPMDASAPHHEGAVPLRVVAIELFEAIVFDGATIDRAVQDNKDFKTLNPLDRALVRMMLTTTIRRLGQIDDLIHAAMNGQDEPKPRLLQTLLRFGVAQIIFMKVPDHAAVNLSVVVAEKIGLIRQKGLVNAVLRRVAREGGAITTRQDAPRLNIPSWMLDDWIKNFGKREALAIATSSLTEAPLDISLKDPNDAVHWAKMLGADILPFGNLRIQNPSGGIEHLPGFGDGQWWIQDAAATLPVKLMGDIAGQTVIDLCAAPGGKTAQAAAAGAHVIAVDRSGVRLDLLRRNLDRLKLTKGVRIIEADGMSFTLNEPADIVLIDAPCTATGTIRRNPDILVHRGPRDVAKMNTYQERLLDNAATLLKPGGLLVYAVCSLQQAEGEGMIEKFLVTHPKFVLEPVTSAMVDNMTNLISPEGYVRALPSMMADQGGIDGFFTATLRYSG